MRSKAQCWRHWPQDAERYRRLAVEGLQDLAKDFPIRLDTCTPLFAHTGLAGLLQGQDHLFDAENEYRTAVNIAKKSYRGFPDAAAYRERLAGVLNELGATPGETWHIRRGKASFDKAIKQQRAAWQRTLRTPDVRAAAARASLGLRPPPKAWVGIARPQRSRQCQPECRLRSPKFPRDSLSATERKPDF